MSDGLATPDRRLPIVDAHVHFFDSNANTHAFLNHKDEVFQALVGDYAELPRIYLLDAYLEDGKSRNVEGIVWHEFLSDDPLREIKWAQHLADTSAIPCSLVAIADFLDPRLEERLEIYACLPNVTAVREHLGWDAANPLRRFAKRPDLLADPAWQKGIGHLRRYDFKCGVEVFSPQLDDLLKVVRLYPDLGFTIAVMGWPQDLSLAGYERWRASLSALSKCQNVCASISAVECIFGMHWTLEQVRPWIRSLIEIFGPKRCMFGSHMPIDGLSHGFETLYDAYREIIAGFSEGEQDGMLRRVATDWFKVRPSPRHPASPPQHCASARE
jgi:predicted TIM-barrel fold metal-dependent hydrolase